MTRATDRPRSAVAGAGPAFWSMTADDLARRLASDPVAQEAPVAEESGVRRWAGILGRQFTSPITAVLLVAASIAAVTGDAVDASIIAAIVVGSAVLGAVQEGRAAESVVALLRSVAVTVEVVRNGSTLRVPIEGVRAGDRVRLSTGDVIPGDALVLDSSDLSVDESALTGESFPVGKDPGAIVTADAPLADRPTAVFAGTHVVSGSGDVLIAAVGGRTILGGIAAALGERRPSTAFEDGVRRFGLLLLRVMLLLVAAVLIITLLLQRPLIDSLLFALALAVGITPQMLPVIVSVGLAAGARRMAKQSVIVKRLDAIEDLGAIDVLCTDKTGTLTLGAVSVEAAEDPDGRVSERVRDLAVLNAGLQTGYANPMDEAILAWSPVPSAAVALAEVPYDFERRRLSIVAVVDGVRLLITKGALESVLACAPAGEEADRLRARAAVLGDRGSRVVALASRALRPDETVVGAASEAGMRLEGLLSFGDPVKPDAAGALHELGELAVAVTVITGDDRRVTASVVRALGLSADRIVTGAELEALDEAALRDVVASARVFAEIAPAQKLAIVGALRQNGRVVGYLGDGINDSDALHAADAGISVDTGANVAKEAAAIILLEKDLAVIADGVRLGRRTFANTLKYVRVASSSNFGNILSMVVASAVLPFLPMLPAQILLLNFLADIPNTLVSRDRLDPERIRRAGTWDLRRVTRFMLVFGSVSTVFDLSLFAILSWGFSADAVTFHSGWFVLSALTQFAAMMSLRTARPIWRSRPDGVFAVVGAGIALFTVLLVYSPVAGVVALVPLPLSLLAVVVALVVGYTAVLEVVKRFVRF